MSEKFSLSQQLAGVNLAYEVHVRQRPKNPSEHQYQANRLRAVADTLGWLMANEEEVRAAVRGQLQG